MVAERGWGEKAVGKGGTCRQGAEWEGQCVFTSSAYLCHKEQRGALCSLYFCPPGSPSLSGELLAILSELGEPHGLLTTSSH